MDAAIPLLEEVVKQRQIFARVAPASTRMLAEGDALRAQNVLNDICIGILLAKGGADRW
jgi:hypothetical protein